MSLRPAKVMLLFEGLPDLPALEAESGLAAHRTHGHGLLFAAKERRRLLPRTPAETPAAHIVFGATRAHHHELQVFSAERPRMLDTLQGGA